jgi:hypothetical protein
MLHFTSYRLIAAALVAGLFGGQIGTARANLIVDGDFSAGTIGSSSIPNWTTSGNVAVYSSTTACCHSGDTGTGNFALFGAGDGADNGVISQSLSTVSGTEYQLTFLYGATSSPAGLGTQSISVSAGDLSTTITSNLAQRDYSLVFSSYTFDFLASGPATTLTFADASTITNSIDGMLDSVSVAAIPEPASIFLLGSSLAALGLMRRKRKAS